jgi:hypothetical protein
MVSIVAFQAVDPGSIPGHRNIFLYLIKIIYFFIHNFNILIKTNIFNIQNINQTKILLKDIIISYNFIRLYYDITLLLLSFNIKVQSCSKP